MCQDVASPYRQAMAVLFLQKLLINIPWVYHFIRLNPQVFMSFPARLPNPTPTQEAAATARSVCMPALTETLSQCKSPFHARVTSVSDRTRIVNLSQCNGPKNLYVELGVSHEFKMQQNTSYAVARTITLILSLCICLLSCPSILLDARHDIAIRDSVST